MDIVLVNAKQLDTGNSLVSCEIAIKGGVIVEIGEQVSRDARLVIDCKGKLVAPGFVDVHVHLREPGVEAKETIDTGTKAAARGGFTTIGAMPNTTPVPDSPERLTEILSRFHQAAKVRVLPYASITAKQLGRELTNFAALRDLGACAFSDDGVGIQSADTMLKAMQQAAALGMPVVAHCEDNTLIHGGVIHEGRAAKKLALPGIPSICESVHIARDVLLAETTGCHYHVCHVSTKESVRVLRNAKRAGIHVTAEVTPHHLLLNEEDITENEANFKMNPPLRAKEDQRALWEGLLDGTIDFIATDHAPHTEEEKSRGLQNAPFGIVGLETAFSLLHTQLVKTEKASLNQLIDWLAVKPAQAFGLAYGQLKKGVSADITLIDVDKTFNIDKQAFVSKGKNTPFHGWKVTGAPTLTIAQGEIVYEEARYGEATTRS